MPVFAVGTGYQDGAVVVALFGDCVGGPRCTGRAGDG